MDKQMDQLESNKSDTPRIEIPKRKFTIEFMVGIFTFLCVGCAAYLAVGLGGMEIMDTGRYDIMGKFDNVSGLKNGASVELAGVPVGTVTNIQLEDGQPVAVVTMRVNKDFQFRDDDILAIRTKGIIGDRYIRISRGASDVTIDEGGIITDTESVVDIEDIIGKLVHSLTNDKNETKSEESKSEFSD